jgi:hypothetical protein
VERGSHVRLRRAGHGGEGKMAEVRRHGLPPGYPPLGAPTRASSAPPMLYIMPPEMPSMMYCPLMRYGMNVTGLYCPVGKSNARAGGWGRVSAWRDRSKQRRPRCSAGRPGLCSLHPRRQGHTSGGLLARCEVCEPTCLRVLLRPKRGGLLDDVIGDAARHKQVADLWQEARAWGQAEGGAGQGRGPHGGELARHGRRERHCCCATAGSTRSRCSKEQR